MSTDPYTPSTEEIREQYWVASGEPSRDSEAKAEFDRWLAAHDAELLNAVADRLDAAEGTEWDTFSDGSQEFHVDYTEGSGADQIFARRPSDFIREIGKRAAVVVGGKPQETGGLAE